MTTRPRRGLTVIELTVLLAVIVTLALLLIPSIVRVVNESRVTRARSDCLAIGSAVVQFSHDNGFFPLWSQAHDGGPGLPAARLDLLVSAGHMPASPDEEPGPAASPGWTRGRTGRLADQLLTNGPGYALKTPLSQFGWNGPYLSSPLGPDPWNNRYAVNIGLIDAGRGTANAGEGRRAVWVLSAGPNGVIETPFDQPAARALFGGDDIVARIQ